MKATRLLSWLERQSYKMSQLNTIFIMENDIRNETTRHEFFDDYFGGQPFGDLKAGFYVYMYFSFNEYNNEEECFAYQKPTFYIPVGDDVILFHQIDRL